MQGMNEIGLCKSLYSIRIGFDYIKFTFNYGLERYAESLVSSAWNDFFVVNLYFFSCILYTTLCV